MYKGTIIVTNDGYVNYTSHPGSEKQFRMECVYSVTCTGPAAISNRFCSTRCARCSIYQMYDINLRTHYWILETCGCKHYAKELYMLDESNHRVPVPLDSDQLIPIQIPT